MAPRPAELQAQPFDLDLVSIKAEDGFPLHGLLYTPKVGATAIVLLVHGKTENLFSGPSMFAPPLLAAQGIASLAFNMRVNSLGYMRGDLPFDNTDSSVQNMAGGAWERLQDGHLDLRAAVDYLHDLQFDSILLAGHSSGGFYCADFAGRYQDFAGLVLLSPLTSNRYALSYWFKDDTEAVAMRQRAQAMVERGEGHHLLPLRTWYWAISAASLLDRMGEPAGCWDEALRRNARPTLLVHGTLESRAEHWRQKFETVIPADSKEFVAIPGSEHMYHDHEDQVVEAIVSFVQRHVP